MADEKPEFEMLGEAAAKAGGTIALHTLSAVNVAEISPFMSEAVDAYLRAYVDAAKRLDLTPLGMKSSPMFEGGLPGMCKELM